MPNHPSLVHGRRLNAASGRLKQMIRAGGVAGLLVLAASTAQAGPIFGFTGPSLSGGFRWDADPLIVNLGGTLYERSLDGGLRYSVEGGSFESYRNMVNRYFDTAVFYDAGKVTSRTSDLDFNGLKNDYGFGVRLHSPVATPLRIEVARSPEGLSFIFASGASF